MSIGETLIAAFLLAQMFSKAMEEDRTAFAAAFLFLSVSLTVTALIRVLGS